MNINSYVAIKADKYTNEIPVFKRLYEKWRWFLAGAMITRMYL